MDEKHQFYLLKPFNLIRLDTNPDPITNWLGRIVPDHSLPEQALPISSPFVTTPAQYNSKPYADMKFTVKATHASSPHGKLLIGKYSHQTTSDSTAKFQPLAVDYIRVKDDDALRQHLLTSTEILSQLRKHLTIGGKPVWVIVGFLAHGSHSTPAPALTKGVETAKTETTTNISATIPASTIAAASGAGFAIPPDFDPEIGWEGKRGHEIDLEYAIEWPCIFAVEYRSLSRVFRVGGLKVVTRAGPQGARTFEGRRSRGEDEMVVNAVEAGVVDMEISKELFWGEEPLSEVLKDQGEGEGEVEVREVGEVSFVVDGQ
ncbi:hypothetical protein LTR99_007183 [Exophiala xenobiotica]|uniref:Uncharacterized protein n=1 Tax=Vermiconidia calcicola TaxID=1690605 RepID=A0AAV9PTN9_9PEZI|nr:hypothetical protein LTR92_007001 [Exophiala xenobiotica]KAK5528976.1 hypothetical protein LTR25_010161 [Vermiconidia calcicola]KAK5544856.1 hypothetical protein LTR23_003985 [Chaetothyriales sp. CCFEE 6169]KAK5220994.1 hypothetical protein LTR72_006552 [Exophiala xenobiotica]KAK5269748.1 hypothetical protein LTR96_005446 [Exophiala xenobiotica]